MTDEIFRIAIAIILMCISSFLTKLAGYTTDDLVITFASIILANQFIHEWRTKND